MSIQAQDLNQHLSCSIVHVNDGGTSDDVDDKDDDDDVKEEHRCVSP